MNDLEKTIHGLELSLLEPEIRSSANKLSELLAEDFIEFGSSGMVYTKQSVLERLPSNTDKVIYVINDFKIKSLSENIILATFKTDRIINDTENLTSLRSSLWRQEDGIWRMFFHQGTPVK